jgi:signal transduction histidine kinase
MTGDRDALELQALHAAIAAGAHALDLDAVLDRCLEQAARLARADAAFIYLRDANRGRYVRTRGRDADGLAPPTLKLAAVESGPPLDGALLLDLHDTTRYDSELHQRARAAGLPHTLMLPLRAADRRIGFVAMAFRSAPVLAETTLRTLGSIADIEAVAIENARAHRDLELRVRLGELLRQFGEQALDPDSDVPALILAAALKIGRGDRAVLSRIYDKDGQLWSRIEHASGKDERLVGIEVPVTETSMAETLMTSGPLVVEDTATLDRKTVIGQVTRRQATASYIMITMRLRGQPRGQILSGSGEPREYNPAEIEAMQLLATMAAQALERDRHETDLREQKARLDTILEHIPIVVTVVDRSGQIVHMNEAARRFTERTSSYSADWREGVRNFEIYDRDGKLVPTEESQIFRAFRGEPPEPCEYVLQRGHHRISIMSVTAPLPSPDGSIDSVVTAFQDVTQLRELSDAKDRFLSIASHELRSPITSLRATTSLLQLDPAALVDEVRRGVLLSRIQRQIDRLATLVERLLDTARLNAGELPLDYAEADLGALCRDAVEHARLTDRDHLFSFVGEPLLPGRLDASRLEQVLTNLLGNAGRYSPPGSEIVVRLTRLEDRARIDVVDHGMGIAAEQLDKLFTPFYRGAAAARYKGGLGLGLYITREIVRRHDGEMRVASEVGLGSTFTVELPLEPRA